MDITKEYIGIKKVKAHSMSADEALNKNYKIGNHQGEEGYEVIYENGYKSWSPKTVFDKAYKEVSTNNNFGYAIDLLKRGFALRRKNWNGKGLFVFKQISSHVNEEFVSKLQSVPESVKSLILSNNNKFIDYNNQCIIYNTVTGIADSWVPSISDIFAEDWEIIN